MCIRDSYWPVGAPDLADELEAARTVRGEDAWASLPLLVIGPHDRMTDGVLEPRGVTPRPGRRVSRIPSFEGLNDAVVAGLGWTLVPVASARPYVEAGTMVRLAEDVIEVPLYWQHWRLESDTLGVLTDAVHAAAALGLSS